MTVYLDIVFIENVLMNYIILFTCVILLKIQLKKIRIFLASSIGAVYTIIMYLNIISIYSNIVMKIILSIAMVYIAFNPKNIKQILKEMIIFYLISFIFGGCVFALMYFIQPKLVQMKNGTFVGTYPIKVAIIGGTVAFVITQISFKLVKTKISKKDVIYRIAISIFERQIEIKALLDTGNLLKEPITGYPVMIVEKNCLKNFLPDEIINNLNKIIGGDTNEIISNIQLSKYISRFRMIPFSSVGKQNGLLLGIRSDKVIIKTDETNEVVNNVIIGVYEKSFTKNGAYSAIFGLDMLEGGNVNENKNVSNVKI